MRLYRLICFFSLPLLAHINLDDWAISKASNIEETLFLRRIADFWQEGEYPIAKCQMEEFLTLFPSSQFADPIRVCLGDLFLREKNYSSALTAYSGISSSRFLEKTLLNQMQCLYCLEWYATLADRCEEYLQKTQTDELKRNATYYLAIALYHQCVNGTNDSETLVKIARRAEPHFEVLLQNNYSAEVAQAFAHLCCILKDYPKAATIYLDLSKQEPLLEDEMTFQAALIQLEFDKNLALRSFYDIASKGKGRSQEAAYNYLILAFEMGRYEELACKKEEMFASVPETCKAMARLYIGQSCLFLQQYPNAIEELMKFLEQIPESETDSIFAGLSSLIDAAYQSNNLAVLDTAIARFLAIDSHHQELSKGLMLRALLLKNSGGSSEAREVLEHLIASDSRFPDRPTAMFELADLDYQLLSWESCGKNMRRFLEEFETHELAPFAWQYLAAASGHVAAQNTDNQKAQEQFRDDLQSLLDHKELFSVSELNDWQFYLAKSEYDLGHLEAAVNILLPLLETHEPFSQEANAYLLVGLCHRDSRGDLAAFCMHATQAIAKNQNLMAEGDLHLSLFNAYLQRSEQVPELVEKCADHLYLAHIAHAEVSQENVLWLGTWYASHYKETNNLLDAQRAVDAFHLFLDKVSDPELIETPLFKLGQLYFSMGKTQDLIVHMENLLAIYKQQPSSGWKWEQEASLLLARGYKAQGFTAKALELLNAMIGETAVIYSPIIAEASFEKVMLLAASLNLETDQSEFLNVVAQLKNLIVQKKLIQEPIHFESALEYVRLLEMTAPNRMEKRLGLLEKIQNDFEKSDDLLSKDYQEARLQYPLKNQIYEDYMRLIRAEILMIKSNLASDCAEQKELQAKAKELLLQINSETAHPALKIRVFSLTQNG